MRTTRVVGVRAPAVVAPRGHRAATVGQRAARLTVRCALTWFAAVRGTPFRDADAGRLRIGADALEVRDHAAVAQPAATGRWVSWGASRVAADQQCDNAAFDLPTRHRGEDRRPDAAGADARALLRPLGRGRSVGHGRLPRRARHRVERRVGAHAGAAPAGRLHACRWEWNVDRGGLLRRDDRVRGRWDRRQPERKARSNHLRAPSTLRFRVLIHGDPRKRASRSTARTRRRGVSRRASHAPHHIALLEGSRCPAESRQE